MHLTKLLVNIALLLLFLFFGTRAVKEWTGDKESSPPAPAVLKNPVTPKMKAPNRPVAGENDYREIITHNLFSPDRVEYVPVVTAPESTDIEPPPLTTTKFTLYGIILMDDFKRALISNPAPKAGDPADIWIQVGDVVGSLTVEDISEQSILVSEAGKPYKIPLYDKQNPKARMIIPKAESAVTVTNIEKTQSIPKVETKAGAEKENASPGDYMDTPFGKVKRNKK